MKQKSLNYLLPSHNIFHPEKVRIFENFDSMHSALLWKSLYLNAVEVLSQYHVQAILILSEDEREFIPERLKQHESKIYFTDLSDRDSLFKILNDKFFTRTENNVLFFSNSIGYTHQDIQKTINLLSINDDALVLAKSAGDKICFTGFNRYDDFLNIDYNNYSEVLVNSCRADNYIYTLTNYLSVNDINDFKRLYHELSKKESLSYCSHEMHEQFTNLFIEYKDIMK